MRLLWFGVGSVVSEEIKLGPITIKPKADQVTGVEWPAIVEAACTAFVKGCRFRVTAGLRVTEEPTNPQWALVSPLNVKRAPYNRRTPGHPTLARPEGPPEDEVRRVLASGGFLAHACEAAAGAGLEPPSSIESWTAAVERFHS